MNRKYVLVAAAAATLIASNLVLADIVVGKRDTSCAADPACFNRIHPDIPTVARARPGERIVFHGRNAGDLDIEEIDSSSLPANPRRGPGVVHPLSGPVHIEGARAGDVLAVTIESLSPGDFGWTSASSGGFAGDLVTEESLFIVWKLNDAYATSEALPNVRIPNGSFPGVVTTLPDTATLEKMHSREEELRYAGGRVHPPNVSFAEPASVCGPDGSHSAECLRTIPPREHGGNMDIRYMRPGTTVYLPCYIDGCSLAVGDFHYAQGDGEVGGSAIEMDGTLTATTRIVRDGPDLSRGPHYEGPAVNLAIPSSRYYATTGYPLKDAGALPREIDYLANSGVRSLTNLSNDINLAARNALASMIDVIEGYGYTRVQAYIIASVAVDMRIGQLVDTPNVGVTAILPLDIFVTD